MSTTALVFTSDASTTASVVTPTSAASTSPVPEVGELLSGAATAARKLERLLGAAPIPARLLFVAKPSGEALFPTGSGGAALSLSPLAGEGWRGGEALPLDPQRFRITQHSLAADAVLPFDDDAFDAVCALDVLDQVPKQLRRSFLRECLRVARHGIIFSFVDASPSVAEVERLAAFVYQQRFGRPHPRLAERGETVDPEEIARMLREADVPFAVSDDAPLDRWLSARLLVDHVRDQAVLAERLRELATQPNRLPGYRKLYACAKTFDATTALDDEEPNPPSPFSKREEGVQGSKAPDFAPGLALVCSPARLGEEFAQAVGDLLTALDREHHAELADERVQTRSYELRAAGLDRLLRALPWRKFARRAPINMEALIPAQQLEPIADGPPHAWRATGVEPAFLIPALLPAGWARIRIRVRRSGDQRPERDVAEFQADFGDGFELGKNLERLVWNDTLADELFLHLPRPAQALSFRPVSAPGPFVVEEFTVEPMSRFAALKDALARKLRLLRAYRCTGRVFFRGALMLLTGRWLTFFRKVFQGLPDSRLMRPENDLNPDVYATWWQRRALSAAERDRLQVELARLTASPEIAVLAPLGMATEAGVRLIVDSLRRQVYPHWRLHAVPAEKMEHLARVVLNRFAATDPRLHVHDPEPAGGVVAACAEALHQIRSPYVAVLNPGYELAESALLRLVQQLHEEPDTPAVVNRAAPAPDVHKGRAPEVADLFRAGAGGPQLHLFRTADLLAGGLFPTMGPKLPPPGAELCRRFIGRENVRYLQELLTYPSTNINPLHLTAVGGKEVAAASARLRPPLGPLFVTGDIAGISGWDYVVFEVVRGLHSLGVDLRLNALSRHAPDLLPPVLAQRIRGRLPGDREFLISPPHLIRHHRPEPGYILLTMWESDRLAPDQVRWLNRASLVIVPSHWGVESFRASGVNVPLMDVPLGHDPLAFHADGSWPEICTFGTAAALWGGGVRKNTQRIIELFQQAFLNEDDVRLRVKITPRCELPDPGDPRIELLRTFLAPADLAEWYRSLTAYVSGSFGEGFGLHLVEAMACARPVISIMYSAVTEYFDAEVGYPVEHHLVPADGDIYHGHWGQPDDESLVRALRAVYENDVEAKRRGGRAAARARGLTWKEAGRKLVEVLREHAS
jgi:glycosyltransferase involved in cell wall biosynthesis/SAM-dependent methyltransferase